MDSNEFIECIGKPEDAPEVQSMLSTVGVTKKMKIPRDDIEARADLPAHGLSLIFKPEDARSSRVTFNAVQFISDAEKGYTSFSGALPRGLLFSDTQAEARKKLGKPHESKPALRRDIWKFEQLRLAIKYAKEAPHTVAVVTVHQPLKD
jgi:hypothetical protein